MKALEAIFTRFLDRKDFTPVDSEPQAKKQKTDQEALAQVREWLSSQFEATLSTICDMVDDPEPGIQVFLQTLDLLIHADSGFESSSLL
jgi:hypothetical protein